jgi:hypothetical protein
MPGAEFHDFKNVKAGKSVKHGMQHPESGSESGGSDTNLKTGPKTRYIDKVAKSTVKRAS